MGPADLSHCYGCGAENPKGMHLKKTYSGERSHIDFEVLPEHNSYPGLMHGGLTCLLMDEVMYYAIARLGTEAVTVSLKVDYRSPALVGQRLVCEAWVKAWRDRDIEVQATITELGTNRLIAEGSGKFMVVDLQRFMAKAHQICHHRQSMDQHGIGPL